MTALVWCAFPARLFPLFLDAVCYLFAWLSLLVCTHKSVLSGHFFPSCRHICMVAVFVQHYDLPFSHISRCNFPVSPCCLSSTMCGICRSRETARDMKRVCAMEDPKCDSNAADHLETKVWIHVRMVHTFVHAHVYGCSVRACVHICVRLYHHQKVLLTTTTNY